MNWLLCLCNFIVNFFKRPQSLNIIPDKLSDEELIVRGIFTPLYYSKSKNELKEGAFLPSPRGNSNDVSVLRANYTTDDFCKNHCSKISLSGQAFCGFATFLVKNISELAIRHGLDETVYLRVSPLREDFKTEYHDRPIHKGLPGLPMHADIFYNCEFEAGKPQTKYRKFAKELALKVSNYFNDDYPDSDGWKNETLTWSPKET